MKDAEIKAKANGQAPPTAPTRSQIVAGAAGTTQTQKDAATGVQPGNQQGVSFWNSFKFW